MTLIAAIVASIALVHGAAAAETTPSCVVPESLLPADVALTRVAGAIKERHRLDITVVGSASSALTGPEGARFAHPEEKPCGEERIVTGDRARQRGKRRPPQHDPGEHAARPNAVA